MPARHAQQTDPIDPLTLLRFGGGRRGEEGEHPVRESTPVHY
jgi:hypothetical protein